MVGSGCSTPLTVLTFSAGLGPVLGVVEGKVEVGAAGRVLGVVAEGVFVADVDVVEAEEGSD